MTNDGFGIFLIVLGVIYIIKPGIFKRWFWKKTDIAQQVFSEKNYRIYMRVIGAIAIFAGVYFIVKPH